MIFVGVALEAGRQVETVVQRRVVLQRAVIEEIADEQVVLVVDGVIDAQQHVVVVGVAGYVEILEREPDALLESVYGVDVGEDDRVVIRRLAPPLPLVVAEEEGAILDERAAQGKAKLVLAQ